MLMKATIPDTHPVVISTTILTHLWEFSPKQLLVTYKAEKKSYFATHD
jgi:hypothetical protein